jgi:hypothetical protein
VKWITCADNEAAMDKRDNNNNCAKKFYVKPVMEIIELRSEERIAKSSCGATQGVGNGCPDPSASPGKSNH